MTPEDKQLISEYMGWEIEFDYYVDHRIKKAINFDLNDASLCVQKMVEKGDWEAFEDCISDIFLYNFELECICDNHSRYLAWLFNPDNFFSAMASWLRSKT